MTYLKSQRGESANEGLGASEHGDDETMPPSSPFHPFTITLRPPSTFYAFVVLTPVISVVVFVFTDCFPVGRTTIPYPDLPCPTLLV